jgi:hypothetical protein
VGASMCAAKSGISGFSRISEVTVNSTSRCIRNDRFAVVRIMYIMELMDMTAQPVSWLPCVLRQKIHSYVHLFHRRR